MAKKKPEPPKPPEDPRQKIRVYRNGTHLLEEFYIDPGPRVIDIDLYYNLPNLEFTMHMNYPANKIKST